MAFWVANPNACLQHKLAKILSEDGKRGKVRFFVSDRVATRSMLLERGLYLYLLPLSHFSPRIVMLIVDESPSSLECLEVCSVCVCVCIYVMQKSLQNKIKDDKSKY